jgi:hypothetical protein
MSASSQSQLRFVTVGDQHIKPKPLTLSRLMVDRIIESISSIQPPPDFVVFMGDALEDSTSMRMEALDLAMEMFSRCVDICQVIVLIGNHDMEHHTNFLLQKHPFNALKRWANTTVADVVTHMQIKGHQLTFCPYVPPGRFHEALNTNPGWEESSIIFSHQAFAGSGFDRGPTVDVWDPNHPLNLVGHWHIWKVLAPNLIYICTPMEHVFGEPHDPLRGITLFTMEQDKTYKYERIPLHLPTHLQLEVPTSSILSFVPPRDTILKVTFKGLTSDNKVAKRLPTIKQWRAAGIVVVFDDVDLLPSNLPPTTTTTVKSIRYRDALWEACVGDPMIEKIYSEFYPS